MLAPAETGFIEFKGCCPCKFENKISAAKWQSMSYWLIPLLTHLSFRRTIPLRTYLVFADTFATAQQILTFCCTLYNTLYTGEHLLLSQIFCLEFEDGDWCMKHGRTHCKSSIMLQPAPQRRILESLNWVTAWCNIPIRPVFKYINMKTSTKII